MEEIIKKFEFSKALEKPIEEKPISADLETALEVINEIISEKPETEKLKIEEEKQKEKPIEELQRPPVILQRTELLKAIENQSIEIIALIDAYPPPKSILLLIH